MRELILLRHAHAEPAADGQSDADRPLTEQGLEEARAAGRWLAAQGLTPDRVLVSPARRAQQTLDAVAPAIGEAQRQVEERIYEATPGTLADLADANRDSDRLLVVGHNPGLERLAALMHSGQSGDYRGMPTASVVVLKLPRDATIEPGVATLSAFWWP